MAKDPPKITKADRLSRALETIRPQRPLTLAPQASRVESTSSARLKKSVIKYPNSSAALRHHVEETRKTEKPISTVRLRSRPAPEPTIRGDSKSVSAQVAEILHAPVAKKVAPAPIPIGHKSAPADEPTVIKTVLTLGDVVRHARRRQGLSQGDVAAAAGTGRRFISEIEAGKPTLEFERLLKVCNALGIILLASETER